MDSSARPSNRLARSASPYLLQHAHNPVDWWPWCDEAFALAKERDVPVFLSVGYSTCYWCHVMERESFEDEATARLLNDHFVAIKVDREERPDVDEIYMAATVMMTGRGGWPMSVFIEPESRRPFYCGTYYPREARPGLPSFTKVLEAMSGAWREQRSGVIQQAEALAESVKGHLADPGNAAELGSSQVTDAVSTLLRTVDRLQGGFGEAPKFPQPALLEFLLDVRFKAEDDSTADAIDLALRATLDGMLKGGIRDQIGGGFHRYSVDSTWTVPHFEKMLIDQAHLLRVYARAARWYGDDEYRRCVRELVGYLDREMTGDGGQFFSALDAESEGREGASYLWTPAQIDQALCPPELSGIPELVQVGREAATFAKLVFGLTGEPNFRDPHHPSEPASWVPRLAFRADHPPAEFQMSPAAFIERVQRVSAALREVRDRRLQPRRDDKVLAAWNGAMIAALAAASRELEDPALLDRARRAMTWVGANLSGGNGELRRSWRAGVLGPPAFLDDYANLIAAHVELARCESGAKRDEHLSRAKALLARARELFASADGGQWFDSRADQKDLFVRGFSAHDGASPSGVSTLLHALLDLAELTDDAQYAQAATTLLAGLSARIASSPVSCVNSTRALLRLLDAEHPHLAHARETTPAAGAAHEAPALVRPEQVVQIFAGDERVSLASGVAEFRLLVQIHPGWHVVAADPGTDVPGLRAFRVDVIGGAGVQAFADYPEGETLGAGKLKHRVYTGTFGLRVALEKTGPITGRPLLAVYFQPCTDRECIAPGAVELDIAIDG